MDNLWSFFILAFGSGLAALLTPCVFPMIPLTVSFFGNKEGSIKKALLYGFFIILIYVLVGIIIAKINGPEFANWLSTHWLPNVLFFIIFLVFALSFFGMFELTLPSKFTNRMDRLSDKKGILGVFFMAFTLVLVSFSCTGPIVGSILVMSSGGEIIKPIVGMFGFSLALALPFTVFAAFPQWLQKLPKSGGWLNEVKVVLGFLELALALKFLSIADQVYHWGILDREVYLALWIVIFSLLGFYLIGKIKLPHDSETESVSVPKLILSVIVFGFVVYLIPGMVGAPLKPLSGYLPPLTSQEFVLNQVSLRGASTEVDATRQSVNNKDVTLSEPVLSSVEASKSEDCPEPKYTHLFKLPHGLTGYFDLEQAKECARTQNKPIFIDFTGHGCVNCRAMEARVWSDPAVLKIMNEEYVVVALYVDDKTELPEESWYTSTYDNKVKKTIGKQNADYQITAFTNNAQPFYVLMDAEGKLLAEPKAYDLNINNFLEFLSSGLRKKS